MSGVGPAFADSSNEQLQGAHFIEHRWTSSYRRPHEISDRVACAGCDNFSRGGLHARPVLPTVSTEPLVKNEPQND